LPTNPPRPAGTGLAHCGVVTKLMGFAAGGKGKKTP
jgi:hypothetical protein